MSGYVDALKRWDDDALPVATGGGRVHAAARPIADLCERLETSAATRGTSIAFTGVAGRERAGDVARDYAAELAARGWTVLVVDLAPANGGAGGGSAVASLEALVEAGSAIEVPAEGGVASATSRPRVEGRSREFVANLQEWLNAQRPHFDRVVVHCGAALEDATAVGIAVWADSTAVVVRAHWTARADLVAARDRLCQAGANLVGAVLYGARPVPPLLGRLLRPFASAP